MPVFIKVSPEQDQGQQVVRQVVRPCSHHEDDDLPELCRHMLRAQLRHGEDVCLGGVNKLQNCMLEQLLEGKKVQFGRAGSVHQREVYRCRQGRRLQPRVNIQGLYLCFAPSRTDVNNLSSKMLKKKASFINVKDRVESKAKAASGDSTTGGSTTGGSTTGGSTTGGSTTGGGTSSTGGSDSGSGSGGTTPSDPADGDGN